MSLFVARVRQGPTERILYTFDYGEELIPGDTIGTSSWTSDAGITIISQSNDSYRANVMINGGLVNTAYTVTNTVLTLINLETLVHSFQVQVVQK